MNNFFPTTKFFHHKASQRHERNWAESIQDDNRTWFHEETDIAKVITNYFVGLFSSDGLVRTDEVVQVARGRITEEFRQILEVQFTKEEVY